MAEAPRWYQIAASRVGKCTKEQIARYFFDAGFPPEYADDEVAWCAAFVGSCLKSSGVSPGYTLLARGYLKWGQTIPARKYGIVILSRPGQSWMGHVGFVARLTNGEVEVLGGNQAGCVNVRSYPKSRVLGYRWPQEMELT